MKDIKKDYYSNDAGFQLKEWWKHTNRDGYLNFCIMNAIKYATRVGRKPDQSADDFIKFQDYARQASEMLGRPYQEVHDAVMQEVKNFMRWNGL